MIYIVKAKQYSSSVQFEVVANDIKDALCKAKRRAEDIFDYRGVGMILEMPMVDVKEKRW